ncbi:MAG: phosphoglycerate dehydrogenase [Rickettsiales bacterium]|jgi:D-3-phosphoglycerate dehydrogenase / 2-oxoglutarate reductase|nr:phosphoglycerate dehydrogenase [Rickettsiales bacterium]
MPKVLISDKLSPQAIDIFKQAGVEVDVKTGLSPDELKAIIGDYDGLAIRSATKVTPEILAAATKLKVIGRAGIGVDNVDVPAATARGVIVMNTPFGNSITTAEHTISLMMALARQIPQANASTHASKWEKNKFMGVELYGKVLGMIGCGNIGSIVADRAQGLKMKVIVSDPFLSAERAVDLNVEKVELPDLLARADFITLHTPLNDTTRNILNKENLARCKKGVRIVNCARGGLIDELALKDAIDSGHVAGAALDVFEKEPAENNPLFGLENVVCTPHLGASTTEAQENVAVQVAEQMSDYLMSGAVTNAINMPSVSAEDAKKLKPYLELADKLGSFAGQLTETGLQSVTIEYEGRVGNLNTKPLTAVALQGLLKPLISSVNMVNAPVIARERGIEVSETKRDGSGGYQSLIRITVTTDKRTRTIAGTVFAGQPRIVDLHGVKLEASLGAIMLYVHNDDKPGLVGGVGSLLGDHKINIANFQLGRNDEHNDAVALIEVDQEIDKSLLEKVAQLPNVKQAKLLRF